MPDNRNGQLPEGITVLDAPCTSEILCKKGVCKDCDFLRALGYKEGDRDA